MKFQSKVDELLAQLESEGRVIHLTDEQILEMDRHIGQAMAEFRIELRRKQAQSEMDTAKIVLVRS